MGKKIEPVIVDGASNWPLFARKPSNSSSRIRSP
jgi:hypothetical protein